MQLLNLTREIGYVWSFQLVIVEITQKLEQSAAFALPV